jgi:glycosyltransferase involved in cell wall biosynthesis
VQTIHELPWKSGVAENADLKHRYWASWGSRRADAILTATEHVAAQLRSNFGVRRERVHVCPWGVSERFEEEPPPGVVDEAVIARYTKSEDAIAFCPGAVRAKKNLDAVLHGLARVRERKGPRIHLLVSGEETADLRRSLGLASQLGLSRWVSTPGEIQEEDLPSVLRSCAVVPVLSLSEGFGLPVLEALGCGTPVVVPENSAQAEVAGASGIRVDPHDPGSVADGLERAVREREDLRYELPDRARELSWERCAAQIEDLWLKLAQ